MGDVFYLLPSKQNNPFFEMVTSERSLFHKKRLSKNFPPPGFQATEFLIGQVSGGKFWVGGNFLLIFPGVTIFPSWLKSKV